jgi:single-stranded-DNA-specific exonuclease
MKYKLINPINKDFSTIEQVMFNRGVKPSDFKNYVYIDEKCINDFALFGINQMKQAVVSIMQAYNKNEKMLVVVDCDCDGYTSAALFINWMNDAFPSYISNIDWYLHDSKQHGLSDCIDLAMEYNIIVLPDSSSNDYDYHRKLKSEGKQVLIFDHHEADMLSENAIVINNQLSDYPNKDLSGVGVMWQFCRYFDQLLKTQYADKYIDLVALGNCGDMMSMLSIETRYLILEGFKPKNIVNPFIFEMWQKNKFKLGESITPIGAAFYIVPFINAICRSGDQKEKELIFSSMLKHKAFEEIPSNKRGHKLGEMERVVDQAMRTCTNVKNRQTRAQDEGLALLESMIEEQNLLNHKVLLFLLEPGQVKAEIRGLIANKFMAKYQRPCCILTKVEEKESVSMPLLQTELGTAYKTVEKTKISYQGSARGYDKSGITNFKDICEKAEGVLYATGHQGAFGLGIEADKIEEFLIYTDEALKDLSAEPVYYVDYEFEPNDCDPQAILDIAEMSFFWGKDFDEALVAVKNINVTKEMVTVMKSNTLKITLPCGISMIKFGATDEEIANLKKETGYVSIDVICTCNANEWMGRVSPQLLIEDYEIVDFGGWIF